MPSTRRFYRQIIQIEVLSEDCRLEWDDLKDIDYAITDGHCSGHIHEVSCDQVDGPKMAELLGQQGSDVAFFGLTIEGDDDPDYPANQFPGDLNDE